MPDTPFKRDVESRAIYQEPAPPVDKDNPFQSMMERFDVAATVRASFGLYNTRGEVDALVRALGRVQEIFGA